MRDSRVPKLCHLYLGILSSISGLQTFPCVSAQAALWEGSLPLCSSPLADSALTAKVCSLTISAYIISKGIILKNVEHKDISRSHPEYVGAV